MDCPKCGRKLEDHAFFNKEANKEADDYNKAHMFTWEASEIRKIKEFDFNKIRYCDTCGKFSSEHAEKCLLCGIPYCREHAHPRMHACRNLPAPMPQPVLPPRIQIMNGIFLLVRIIVVLFGIWVVLTGSDIVWGNRSGHHVTFPFAGFIVSFIGFAIIVVALRYPRL